jgi:acetyl-CoA carboxylase biotin carboxyl carrier protein
LSLNAKDVAEILKALEASSFDTLDLELNGVKLQLRRSAGRDGLGHAVSQPGRTERASAVTPMLGAAPAPAGNAPLFAVPAGAAAVPAPLLGIFYRAPKPGEPPFVEVGARVEAETIIGIIEVMKLMNSVRAGLRGTVVAIPARNGELVEYGEALLFVRPD